MSEYIIIELENSSKYALIDTLVYDNIKYFLVVNVSKGETFVDSSFKICKYNEEKNCFEKIEDEEKLIYLKQEFLKILNKKEEIDTLLNNLGTNLIKLRVKDIDNSCYKLEDSKGKIIIKNLIFYNEKIPKLDDYIYLSKNIINEQNIFQYGNISNLDKINIDEIIKIETNNSQYFLQRYYG